ncbi:MAG: FAD-dependent oxidoreductase [Acidobacteria bacterium]|nr:FAD-dependent oxidoreductase [Acidobacteriota bacterium]MCU0253669.1 FAD-dependent oxidoreductase [Acidobacteriota bacterium]
MSGLECARGLARAGHEVLVLDKARGVGGRCATRRVEGQPVDHGIAFLHGRDPAFLAALDAVAAGGAGTSLEGWPSAVSGTGSPCQPDAFAPGERRVAFAEGVSAFPKHLAKDLRVRLQTRVTSLALAGTRLALELDDGGRLDVETAVLALPLEQARELLATLPAGIPELDGVRTLLSMLGTLPCLSLMAGYPLEASAAIGFDLCYPEGSRALQLVAHDSAKRAAPAQCVLVFQARPAWSRERLEAEPAQWAQELLEQAARLCGDWVARPLWQQTHRWRYARVDRGSELAAPILVPFPGGARLALSGELFAPGGGVEAAFLSGRRLAARLHEDTA